MKISKKLLSLLLCAIMVLGSVAVGGEGFANVLDTFSVEASAATTLRYSPVVSRKDFYDCSGSTCIYGSEYSWTAFEGAAYYIFYQGAPEHGEYNYSKVVYSTRFTVTGAECLKLNSAPMWFGDNYIENGCYYVIPYSSNGTPLVTNPSYISKTNCFLYSFTSPSHDVYYFNDAEKFYVDYICLCNESYKITDNVPTKPGYTFLGWSTSSSATTPQYTSGQTIEHLHANSEKIYLYAVWKANTYTITYNANGGSGAPSSQKKTHDKTLTLSSSNPTRNGYTFLGWSESSTATSASYSAGGSFTKNSNVTLYAVWKANTYTVSYSANGGSGAPSSQKKTHDKTLTLSSSNPTRNGYTFLGWSESSTATSASYSAGGSFTKNSNVTLYAVWQKNAAKTYTISYNANGGSGAPANQTKTAGIALTLSATKPAREGYTFLGWAETSTATTAAYQPGGSFTKDANATLYAVWQKNAAKTYTVTYNANGGSGAPANQAKTAGIALTLSATKPTKDGYTFLGWAETSTATTAAYQPGGSFTKDANTTLYAVWQQQGSSFSKSNRYAFANSKNNFVTSWSGEKYYLTEDDSDKLFSYIKKYSKNPDTTISSVQSFMNEKWGGSCYGMASTAILDYSNQVAFNENFGNGAQTMNAIKSPSLDKNLMSAINYYMVSQKIDFIRNSSVFYEKGTANWSAGLKKLVSTVQKGDPILFCYYFSRGGHAIVAYDCITNADGSISVIAYDNRFPNQDTIIAIDKDYKSCVVNGNENALAIEFYTEMSAFDKIDIDGPNNDMNIIFNSYSYENPGSTEIQFLAKGDVTITNDAGQTLTFKDGVFGGDMPITSKRFIVCETTNGDGNEVEFIVNVADSDSFTLESTSENKSFAVTSSTMYAAASATNADAIVIGEGEGVYVIGSNMAYSTSLVSKDNSYDTVIVEGNSENDVSLTYAGNNILVSGVTGTSEKLTVYTHNTEYTDYTVQSGYSDVAITSGAGGVDVKGSSSGNSNYDVSVVKTSESSSNSQYVEINNYIDSIKVDYRSKLTFNFNASNIPEGSAVHWYVNGVDKGTSSAYIENTASKDFNIQARMVSKEGTVLAESKVETVKVKSGFFDKLIAFFRNLFKTLPEWVDNQKIK